MQKGRFFKCIILIGDFNKYSFIFHKCHIVSWRVREVCAVYQYRMLHIVCSDISHSRFSIAHHITPQYALFRLSCDNYKRKHDAAFDYGIHDVICSYNDISISLFCMEHNKSMHYIRDHHQRVCVCITGIRSVSDLVFIV